MVNRIAKIIIGLTLAGLILWGLIQLIPTEEKRIQQRLLKVASLVTFTGREGNLTRVARVNALGNAFTVDGEVVLEGTGFGVGTVNGRAEIQQTAMYVMTRGRGATVQFDDIVVKVSPDKQTATAELTARVTVTGERDFGLQELRFSLKKVDGAWLIARVEPLKTFGQ